MVVMAMVRRRMTHDKVGVRRTAVQALEALMRMDPPTNKEVHACACVCVLARVH